MGNGAEVTETVNPQRTMTTRAILLELPLSLIAPFLLHVSLLGRTNLIYAVQRKLLNTSCCSHSGSYFSTWLHNMKWQKTCHSLLSSRFLPPNPNPFDCGSDALSSCH